MPSARVLRCLTLCCALLVAAFDANPQDNWQGGNGGNWSVGSNWSTGLPHPTDNVVIYSGGTDLVYLDTNSAITSLTLGGPYLGNISELTDNGAAPTLAISGPLTVNQSGVLRLISGTVTVSRNAMNAGDVRGYGGSSLTVNGGFDNQNYLNWYGGTFNTIGTFTNDAGAIVNFGGATAQVGALVNNGYLEIDTTLAVAGGPLITDIPATATYNIYGNFTISGSGAFASLTTIEGSLNLYNQTTTISPIGGYLSLASGAFLGASSTNLAVSGNVANQGWVTVFTDGPASVMSVSGTLNNAGTFNVGGGSTLTVNGDVSNSGLFSTRCECPGGNTLNFNGNLTNQSTGIFQLGYNDTATIGKDLANFGNISLGSANTLTVAGNMNNSGILATAQGGNTLKFTGLLTNTSTGQINLNGSADLLQANGGIANSGSVTVSNSSTVDPPFLNNLGSVNIDSTSKFVVGTGTASGVGYVQLANGTLGEIISPSAFGTISVAGPASLNGTLDILLQHGFNPAVGTTYQIILFSPAGLSGSFAAIQNDIFNNGTEFWKVIYDTTGGYVELAAAPSSAPEPTTFLLLGTGLISLAYGVRRRRGDSAVTLGRAAVCPAVGVVGSGSTPTHVTLRSVNPE